MAQVTFVPLGWGLAQFPHLVTPDVTIQNAAAPESTLKLLLIALGAGAVVLLPSLFYLFQILRGRNSVDVSISSNLRPQLDLISRGACLAGEAVVSKETSSHHVLPGAALYRVAIEIGGRVCF